MHTEPNTKVDLQDVAQKLDEAGFEVYRMWVGSSPCITVSDRHHNALTFTIDGQVLFRYVNILSGFLLSAVNRTTGGLVVSGLRKHARLNPDCDTAFLKMHADMTEDQDPLWDTIVSEHCETAGRELTPSEVVQNVLLMAEAFLESQSVA